MWANVPYFVFQLYFQYVFNFGVKDTLTLQYHSSEAAAVTTKSVPGSQYSSTYVFSRPLWYSPRVAFGIAWPNSLTLSIYICDVNLSR